MGLNKMNDNKTGSDVRKTETNASSVQNLRQKTQQVDEQYNRVLKINATAQLQLSVVRPTCFEDARGIADQLNEMHTIILNFELTEKATARRLMDFLGGVAYAYNGQVKRIANNSFMIAPYNVDIMGDLADDLQSCEWDNI